MGRKGVPPRASRPGLWAPLCLLAARSMRDTAGLWLPATLYPCHSISPQTGHGKAAVDALYSLLAHPTHGQLCSGCPGAGRCHSPKGGTCLGDVCSCFLPRLGGQLPWFPWAQLQEAEEGKPTTPAPPLFPLPETWQRGQGTDPSRQGTSPLWVRPHLPGQCADLTLVVGFAGCTGSCALLCGRALCPVQLWPGEAHLAARSCHLGFLTLCLGRGHPGSLGGGRRVE